MTKAKDKKEAIPKGRPISGRIWKTSRKKFSSIKKDKPFHTSWKTKMEEKQNLKLIKAQDQAMKEAKKQEKNERKKRRRENLKKRKENEKKAEVVQVITNTAKLKRMKKSQWKHIEKR